MQSPSVMEAGEEVLQVLEVCDTAEEVKEVIVTTIDGSNTGSLPAACSGPATKPSQVRRSGPTYLTKRKIKKKKKAFYSNSGT